MAIVLLSLFTMLLTNWSDVINHLFNQDTLISELKYNNLIDISKNQVYGSDVIGFIRYFSSDVNTKIEVENDSGTRIYTNETYNKSIFSIDYTHIYNVIYQYSNDDLIKIECIQK